MAATLSRPPPSPTKGLKTAGFALNLLSPPLLSHCRTHCKPLHLLANERCPPHLTCSTAFSASSSLPLLPFPAAFWPPPGTITCCALGIKASKSHGTAKAPAASSPAYDPQPIVSLPSVTFHSLQLPDSHLHTLLLSRDLPKAHGCSGKALHMQPRLPATAPTRSRRPEK